MRIANDVIYGLAAAVWTRGSEPPRTAAARALRAGVVYVNCYDADDITVPFGGYKQSGFGRDKSLHAFDKYTELKTTWIDLARCPTSEVPSFRRHGAARSRRPAGARVLAVQGARSVRERPAGCISRERSRPAIGPACGRGSPAAYCCSSRSSRPRAPMVLRRRARAGLGGAYRSGGGTLACEFTGRHPAITQYAFRRAAAQGWHLRQLREQTGTRPDVAAGAPRGARACACPGARTDHAVAGYGGRRVCTGAAIASRPARRRCGRISPRACCCAHAGTRWRRAARSSSTRCVAQARW